MEGPSDSHRSRSHTLSIFGLGLGGGRVSDTTAYEITRADNLDAFRRLHPAFETLSVAEMVHVSVRVPVHAGAMRFYRERGWLP